MSEPERLPLAGSDGAAAPAAGDGDELAQLRRELAAARAEQAATAEILRAIASSPGDARGTLQAIVESAARLCPVASVGIWRVDGDEMEVAAQLRKDDAAVWIGRRIPISDETVGGRAIRQRATIHTEDLTATISGRPDHPFASRPPGSFVPRTALAMPLR